MKLGAQVTTPVKFDWLERTTRPSVSGRVNAALSFNRGNLGFANRVGGRGGDPWVPANRDISSLFARLHPPKSEGRFFLRWSQGDGEGRLQFVEWFKSLLEKYQQHQIVIFDPYFEDAGLGLLLLCAAQSADYIVFTSLPKSVREDKLMRRKSDGSTNERINNLLRSCELNLHFLKRIKLRIIGMKEGRLHDRYILVIGPDGLPTVGFNLSNSFQSAAQNYPLLITPIPSDTLLDVEQYKSGLVREMEDTQSDGETENPSMQLLFDSSISPTELSRYEPLGFLENAGFGDVLSVWTKEPSLQGLSGDELRDQMMSLGLLNKDSHVLLDTTGLHNWLDQQAGEFSNFTLVWELIGEVLAHSTGSYGHRFDGLESEHAFLEFLASYLEASFDRAHEVVEKEFTVIDAKHFREAIEDLLHSAYHPDHLFHATKYAALTWAEYYTIKFLWWYTPDRLVAITEAQIAKVPVEPQSQDVVQLSILSQIVSEIALSVQFEINEVQRVRLVDSKNGLLQWMGLNAIERQLEHADGLDAVLSSLAPLPHLEQVRALGWMTHHAARNTKQADRYKSLVEALHEALPAKVSAEELSQLVESMRGHMQGLGWAEPWLFQDVIFPLIQKERADTDDACNIWVQELVKMLEPEQRDGPQLFDRTREGQTTNTAAFLFAYSSYERQQASLELIWAILKRQQRIVWQPLASTSNWTRWDNALVISMWILTFTLWGRYYLGEMGMTHDKLEELSREARELALVRPYDEWHERLAGNRGELPAFLDQVEELLTHGC